MAQLVLKTVFRYFSKISLMYRLPRVSRETYLMSVIDAVLKGNLGEIVTLRASNTIILYCCRVKTRSPLVSVMYIRVCM